MKDKLKKAFMRHLTRTIAKSPEKADMFDRYQAMAMSIRDVMVERWISTQEAYEEENPRAVYYLSLEYLMGRAMGNAIMNLGIFDDAREAAAELGFDLEEIREEESDAGLGNGGLGRLAACFLDSMATMNLPGLGYGIRYEYGIFEQLIDENGNQVENPDNWLSKGNVWEVQRPERAKTIKFYGKTLPGPDKNKKYRKEWVETQNVTAVPYDTPIPGYQTNNVNTLRLWSAQSQYGFNLSHFNRGDYLKANLEALVTENITKVLYPNDNNYEGKELRLKQQYFLVSATLQDIIDRMKRNHCEISELHEKSAIQLNDTHPALAVPELMRLLVDEEGFDWEAAWGICTKTFNYTNHTLMSEALERWPVNMMEKLIPRILEIIYELNSRFLKNVLERYPDDTKRMRRMSLIEEGPDKNVRMAHIAILGSTHVNGVAKLHTELLKNGLFRDFNEWDPEKIINVTNGITPRRWLKKANPELAELITASIGDNWVKDLGQLKDLEGFREDAGFRAEFRKIKLHNKQRLAEYIQQKHSVLVNPESIFDVQVKRLHEYKRQLLNILHIISLYIDLKENPGQDFVPRTFIFAAKAAPGYFIAKLIIRLINNVADVINTDKRLKDKIKVLFLSNYRVSLAEKIIPAADVSEQISTAGTEASGTGNMKFALNGALTIGTMDGANIEIHDAVGPENIFIFGMNIEEARSLLEKGYQPQSFIDKNPPLKRALEFIRGGSLSPSSKEVFKPILESFIYDRYMVAADFDSYRRKQREISGIYPDCDNWTKKAITNVANMGGFSSDRSIRDYCEKVWHIKPLHVKCVDVLDPEKYRYEV